MIPNAFEKKILIVEDEQLIAHSIERSLSRAGYSVPAMAASAEEAFERIEETQPDLVLMDIHIQGARDGVETAKIIREKYHLPVIYLTAHADGDTLERAKVTEPLGYLVKPVNHASLPSSIEMALYKHKVDRQLEENRALLATILDSIADAVIVTNGSGQVQFLNRRAENLTGWSQAEASNQSFEKIATLDTGSGAPLLLQALASSRTIQIPRDATLRTKNGLAIFVDGHIAVSSTEGRAAGAMVTLHDATVRRQEEQRLRQEQRMLSVGQMANDIAHDFYGLFDLISSFSEQLVNTEEEENREAAVAELSDYINRTSRAGVSLARQLVDLGSSQGTRPSLISLNQILADRVALYNHVCGASILVEANLRAELDLVLNNALHLEKLALNLVLSAKHSMPYGGTIRVSTENVSCPGEKGTLEQQFVSLRIESHRNMVKGDGPFAFSAETQNSELMMTVVNAIVAASEGSISVREQSESLSTTEVLLPAIASVVSQGAQLPDTKRSVVLTVGLDSIQSRHLGLALANRDVLLLQANDAREASLISGFVEGSLEVLIVNGASVAPAAQGGIASWIGSHWPTVNSLLIRSADEKRSADSSLAFSRAIAPVELVPAVLSLLAPRADEDFGTTEINSLSVALHAASARQILAVPS